MSTKMTERAARVIDQAKKIARAKHNEYVGTEHLLLALLRDDLALCALVIRERVPLAKLTTELETCLQQGEPMVTMGSLPMSPRLRQVIEKAVPAAQQFGCGYVSTEHLLLGLLLAEESVASQALVRHGVTLEYTTARLETLLQQTGSKDPAEKYFVLLLLVRCMHSLKSLADQNDPDLQRAAASTLDAVHWLSESRQQHTLRRGK
jgi:ATP-dependent Clp protease ATP-binding subunit ClpA